MPTKSPPRRSGPAGSPGRDLVVSDAGGHAGAPRPREYGSLGALPLPRLPGKPGQILPQALRPVYRQVTPSCFLVAWTVVWNTASVASLVYALQSGRYATALVATLAVAVGVWLVWLLLKPLTGRLRKVPTLEIEGVPMNPGKPCRVALRQPGPLDLDTYRIDLVCLERAEYREATSRTEIHVLHEQTVLERHGHRVTARDPWCHEWEITLPAALPGSFAANNNQIEWHLRVRAKIPGAFDLDETYPFIVLPPLDAP